MKKVYNLGASFIITTEHTKNFLPSVLTFGLCCSLSLMGSCEELTVSAISESIV